MLYRCVNFGKLVLELIWTRIQLWCEHSKLAEKNCIDDGAKEETDCRHDDLWVASWSTIIACHEQHGGVKCHEVAIENALIVHIEPVFVSEIHRRDPLLRIADQHPPHAGKSVQIDHQEED